MYRMGQEEIDEVARVIRAKQLFRVGDPAQGHLQEVERFEQEWAELIGTRYALFMSGGGTAALTCGLAGLGIGPGDEVIVPAFTWMATATTVLSVGAIPVLAEVDETLALDPDDVARKIGPHTRAVIPVHMSGRPCAMDRLLDVARAHGVKVLEDSCQADGGSYKGKRTGSWGDAGAFSFNVFKIITAGGEGGALVTDNREVYERAFVFHDSGSAFRPMAGELSTPIFVAQQYRASEVMGALARVQTQRLEGILTDLRRVRDQIMQALDGAPGIRFAPNNDLAGDCGVAILLQFDSETQARAFAAVAGNGYLGIDSGKHVYTNWAPLCEKRAMHHPAMNPFNFPQNQGLRMNYGPDACPRTLELLRRSFFLPLNPDWTEEEIEKCIAACLAAGKAISSQTAGAAS